MPYKGSAVVRKELTACTDEYRRDWTPILEGTGARVSYGHDIENIWLLADAVQTVGQSNAPWLDLYRRLFDYSKRHGYDTAHGGFFYRGPFNEDARERQKIWWVQAEGLMSALTMYRLTREPEYAQVFESDAPVGVHAADRLDERRVVCGGSPGWINSRREGGPLEGGLPQRTGAHREHPAHWRALKGAGDQF